MQAVTIRRLKHTALITAPLMLCMAATGFAADISINCPAAEVGPQVSLRFNGDMLAVTDKDGTNDLAASLQGDAAGVFTIYGSGAMNAMMPNGSELDQCIAEKLKQLGATAADADALGSVSNTCQQKLLPTAVKQNVQVQFTVTSIDKGAATLFIQRQYLTPSAVTGKPLWLDEWPLRNCEVGGT